MEIIKCMIVDDEPLGRDVLEKFILQTPGLKLSAVCKNGFEALQFIHEMEIDLIFLDINMPKLSGLSFVKTMTKSPKVIFVTAYPEYAVEGFEVNAVDYLVKPVSFERFIKSVNKVKELMQLNHAIDADSIFVKVEKKLFKLRFSDIFYIEAYGDYLKLHTGKNILIATETMKNIEDKLPVAIFQRIHKSFIINLTKMEFIEANQVRIKERFLPVGATYKEEFEKRLKK
jgi:DNA-binding LytR/AlgR family response regulator